MAATCHFLFRTFISDFDEIYEILSHSNNFNADLSFEAVQVKVGDKVPADLRLVELHSSMIRVEQPLGKNKRPTITKLEDFSKLLLQSI